VIERDDRRWVLGRQEQAERLVVNRDYLLVELFVPALLAWPLPICVAMPFSVNDPLAVPEGCGRCRPAKKRLIPPTRVVVLGDPAAL
jgi:hypothetical protein